MAAVGAMADKQPVSVGDVCVGGTVSKVAMVGIPWA